MYHIYRLETSKHSQQPKCIDHGHTSGMDSQSRGLQYVTGPSVPKRRAGLGIINLTLDAYFTKAESECSRIAVSFLSSP